MEGLRSSQSRLVGFRLPAVGGVAAGGGMSAVYVATDQYQTGRWARTKDFLVKRELGMLVWNNGGALVDNFVEDEVR